MRKKPTLIPILAMLTLGCICFNLVQPGRANTITAGGIEWGLDIDGYEPIYHFDGNASAHDGPGYIDAVFKLDITTIYNYMDVTQ